MTDADTRTDVVPRRIVAFLADGILVAGAVRVVARRITRSRFVVALITGAGAGVVGLLYHVLCEGTVGQTVGKRLLGIAVRREDGGPCSLTAAGVRTAFRFVDWLPAGYLVGFLSMAFSDRDQRIGDRCAGTVVVRRGASETGGNEGSERT